MCPASGSAVSRMEGAVCPTEYLKGILWKINERGLSFQGKLAAFVVNVKSELPMRLLAS